VFNDKLHGVWQQIYLSSEHVYNIRRALQLCRDEFLFMHDTSFPL
jgi:hypothetical protein